MQILRLSNEKVKYIYAVEIDPILINHLKNKKYTNVNLYNEDLKVVKTVPFWHNYGYIFHGPNKWHGMAEGKEIQVERRGIQLNYVTFETDWPVNEYHSRK